ncbi:hypothetical protein HDU76_003575, partial [Blyttiomyces sp. JEL0837]
LVGARYIRSFFKTEKALYTLEMEYVSRVKKNNGAHLVDLKVSEENSTVTAQLGLIMPLSTK